MSDRVSTDDPLSSILKIQPDALLLDFASDPSFAFKFCDSIQNSSKIKHLPVLVVTDVEDLGSILDLLSVGACDFVLEPYAPCELQARIRNIIAKNGNSDASFAKRIEKRLDDFDLIEKIETVKEELQGNADEMIDLHEQLRNALENASEVVAKAEYSLQFTDRVAQQVNEIGKLIYGIHMGVKREQKPYTEKESDTLQKSSSESVLDKMDRKAVDDLLDSLDI